MPAQLHQLCDNLWISCPLVTMILDYTCMQANTARVVFSWNENDPTNDDAETGLVYHGFNNRGSASLNLLGGLINIPADPPAESIGSFNVTVNNVSSS